MGAAVRNESENTDTRQRFLPAGLETNSQFPLGPLKRQDWKHDGAGGEKDTYDHLLFLSISSHY